MFLFTFPDEKVSTPFMMSLEKCSHDVSEMMMSADINAAPYIGDDVHENSFQKACRFGNLGILNLLLEKHNPDKIELMYCCIDYSSSECFSSMLTKKNINTKLNLKKNPMGRWVSEGSTFLHYSIERGEKEITEILLKAGAYVNVKNKEGLFPIICLNYSNIDVNIVRLLLHNIKRQNSNIGKNLSFYLKKSFSTVLNLLIAENIPNYLCIDYIELFPSSIFQEVNIFESALERAVRMNNYILVKFILGKGADINYCNHRGEKSCIIIYKRIFGT